MKTSSSGTTLIKAFESCLKPTTDGRFRTYRCPANVLTIGWGTTRSDAPDLHDGDVWTREQCDSVFDGSLGAYEAAVEKAVAGRAVPLQQHKFDALVSLVYNCGPGALAGSIGKAVREGRDADVPGLLAKWNKGGGKVLAGLVRRRKAEGLLYMGDFDGASKVADAHIPGMMPQAVDAPTTMPPALHPAAAPAVAATVAATAAVAHASGVSPEIVIAVFGLLAIAAATVFAIRSRAQ